MNFAQLGPLNQPGPLEYLADDVFKKPELRPEPVASAGDRRSELEVEVAPLQDVLRETATQVAYQLERMVYLEAEYWWTELKFHRTAGRFDPSEIAGLGGDPAGSVGAGMPDLPVALGGTLPTDNLGDEIEQERGRSAEEIERRESRMPPPPDERDRGK